MKMLIRPIAALVSLTITLSVSATSWHDNSHYVTLGPRTGYYIVRPGSSLSHQLGIDGAPTVDTADPFRHGYGADALAFRFNPAGVLSAPPAYIVQARRRTNFTLGVSVRLFAGRASCRTRRHFLANPRASNADPTVSSLITRSRFTTHLKVAVEEGDDKWGPQACRMPRPCSAFVSSRRCPIASR
jgi:hypothetical protein